MGSSWLTSGVTGAGAHWCPDPALFLPQRPVSSRSVLSFPLNSLLLSMQSVTYWECECAHVRVAK